MPQPLGMLEQRHRHLHDRGRPLHPRLRLLRRQHRQTAAARKPTNRPAWPKATRRMNLQHVVITAVARDDLRDGGADHFRRTIEKVRAAQSRAPSSKSCVPDFLDNDASIDSVLAARPHIYNHNLETVRRLTPAVRHRATYDRSLSVLGKVKAQRRQGCFTKSGLMLGLGETEEELVRRAGRPAPRRLRHSDPGPIPAADPAPFARRRTSSRRTVLRATRPWRNKWVSSMSPAARWCAAPTTPTNSTCRRLRVLLTLLVRCAKHLPLDRL